MTKTRGFSGVTYRKHILVMLTVGSNVTYQPRLSKYGILADLRSVL